MRDSIRAPANLYIYFIYYADRPRGCIIIRRRKGHAMKTAVLVVLALFGLSAPAADEVSTFRSYVDTDICARLMLGPITETRIGCTQQTAKDKAEPVLVRLRNNMVFTVN